MFDPNAFYYFPDYIDSFLANRESIESDYPELYRMIVLFLFEFDTRESFDKMFPEQEFFKQLRKFLNSTGFGEELIYDGFQRFLYNIGLPNFYKNI